MATDDCALVFNPALRYNAIDSPFVPKNTNGARPMEQKNANEKIEKTPRKRKWLTLGCLPLLIGGLIGLVLSWIGFYPLPLDAMPIGGTVVILDENGKAIPFRPTQFTSFSHFAPTLPWSELKRTRTFRVDESGKFSRKIPAFATTLYFFTEDGKHAAVVDITPSGPPRRTDLTIELRPRYAVTGRLVRHDGTPVANRKIELEYMQSGDSTVNFFSQRTHAMAEILHSVVTTTDAEGLFTFDNVIPGIEYVLISGDPWESGNHFAGKRLTKPILEPEQYQEPFDLGDVSVSAR